MTIRRLFPVLLVLLQSGLAAAHAHAHPGLAGHTKAPHLHAHELLDFFVPGNGEHGEGEGHGGDHDFDAIDLSDLSVSPAPPPALDVAALDLAAAEAGPVAGELPAPPPALLGLPPATAGPSSPRYITFCVLTI